MLLLTSMSISLLLLTLFLAIPQEARGQISFVPDGLLDFISDDCIQSFEDVVLPCAIANLCFDLIPSEEELAAIPDESQINDCDDVEAGLCPITSRCPPCKEKADDFFKCIIVNNEAGSISQNVTDLITGCPLDCNSVLEVPADSSVPTQSPIEPSISLSSAPTEASEASVSEAPVDSGAIEATEAPADSGTLNRVAPTRAIISGTISLALGLFYITL